MPTRRHPWKTKRGSRPAPASAENEQLELAREVQRSLLPSPVAPMPRFELVARFAPAHIVAGDFYDYFQPTPNLLGFYLGDVQGKGLEGAMYAALVSGIMRGLEKTGKAPERVLEFLNRRLRLRPIPNKFCTLCYGVVDLERQRLHFSNAGLPFPLLCRRGRVTRIELPGFPLGLFDEASYDKQEVLLESGDTLLFFTDGLTDSIENPRVPEGEPLVCEVLANHFARSAEQVADRLHARLPLAGKQPLTDDATFLLLRLR